MVPLGLPLLLSLTLPKPSPKSSSHPAPPPPARPHPSGKKLSIMRSPRGFTASAPICCRSTRLSGQSSSGVGRAKTGGLVKEGSGPRETEVAGPEAGAPSPQVALLVPVQGPKPVVEAEQTGLRDCGAKGGRVTGPPALGTRGGTLPGDPRPRAGDTSPLKGTPRGPRRGCRGRGDALPRGNRATRASPLRPHPPPPRTAELEDTCLAAPLHLAARSPGSRARHPARPLEPPRLRTPPRPGSEPRSPLTAGLPPDAVPVGNARGVGTSGAHGCAG